MNGGDGGGVKAAPDGQPAPLEWKFSQVFGERTAGEEVQEGKTSLICIYMYLIMLLDRYNYRIIDYGDY